MKYYKTALYIAARYAYEEEVVRPGMVENIIGENEDFATKEYWVDARVQEWLDEAEIERTTK